MEEKLKLIIDTDLGFDCDDAAALAIANIYSNSGAADIVAITHCIGQGQGADCIELINQYYGTHCEVGISDCSTVDIDNYYQTYFVPLKVVDGFGGFGEPPSFYKFLNAVCPKQESRSYPDAVRLIIDKLAMLEDGSATILAIGQQNNIAKLVSDEPSGYWGLSNYRLLGKKLKKLIIMGGNFQPYDHAYEHGGILWESEFNIYLDRNSAAAVAERKDLPIDYIDFNCGKDIFAGSGVAEQTDNPVRAIYSHFPKWDMPTWDLVAALYAFHGEGELFSVSERGQVTVTPSGKTVFASGKGNHRLVSLEQDSAKLSDTLNTILRTKMPYQSNC